MNTTKHIFLYYVLLAVNYLWVVGASLSVIQTENQALCSTEEKTDTLVILYGSLGFFACGFFHSLQKTYFSFFFLKIYNYLYLLFAFVLLIMGIIRLGRNFERSACPYMEFMNNLVTCSYILIYGSISLYIALLLFLELCILAFYGLKCLIYSFVNACVDCYACICPGVTKKRLVFVAPVKRPSFMKYIKKLCQDSSNETKPSIVVAEAVKDQSNISNFGLSEAEKKKILYSL